MIQFSYPNSQFTNILGGAGVGWSMYVYDTGTTDLASIYSDVGQTVPADNPVVSDSNGMFASFYWTGTVDVVVKDENGDTFDSAVGIQDLISTIIANLPTTSANIPAGIASGSGDTIAVTLPITSDFVDLDIFVFRANAACSGTLNTPNLIVNSYPSRRIKKIGGSALIENDIITNQNCLCIYNESQDVYYLLNHEATFLKRDGTAAMLANLDMGNFKVSNMAAAAVASDAVRLDQMQYHYGGTATGTADAMIVTASTVLAYTDGMMIRVNAPAGGFSTVGSPTININSLGAKSICDNVGRGLTFGDVQGLCVLVYSSTFGKFVLENPRYGNDPIGSIHYTYATFLPRNDILADGQVYLRSDFPVLTAYILSNPDYYVGEGSWSANKGKFSTGNGTTNFRAPLIEGRFLRALDRYSTVDPGRTFASEQDFAIENITGELGIISGSITSTTGVFATNGTTDDKIYADLSGTNNRIVFDASTVVNTAAETRPVNMAYFVSIRAL